MSDFRERIAEMEKIGRRNFAVKCKSGRNNTDVILFYREF